MSSKNIDTRERILRATWTLLEANPAESVRMGDIAKKAGISRQAVYLHFPTRAELLVATARYLDEVKKVDDRLAASRSAATGVERLDAFIEAWGNYIPEIAGIAKAFLAMQGTDEAAAIAWNDRMQAVREGCAAAVEALRRDGALASDYAPKQATDLLWTLLSVHNSQQLTGDCGWPQKRYIETMKRLAHQALVRGEAD
ncbi:MAG: TetR/AcrR family transcriptional regulator [Sphingomonadales bacterium]|nr:TetR/AcrR family transcriptional regulator [Sphingomonadales bacterium]